MWAAIEVQPVLGRFITQKAGVANKLYYIKNPRNTYVRKTFANTPNTEQETEAKVEWQCGCTRPQRGPRVPSAGPEAPPGAVAGRGRRASAPAPPARAGGAPP